ncbi:hypothetical protein RYX36_019130, partial [Vicia faba]
VCGVYILHDSLVFRNSGIDLGTSVFLKQLAGGSWMLAVANFLPQENIRPSYIVGLSTLRPFAVTPFPFINLPSE